MEVNDLRLLGLKVRDKVTGFSGIVMTVAYDLPGCIQAVVTPPADEKGEYKDGKWLDVARLEVLDPVPVMEVPGDRFRVPRAAEAPTPTRTHGAADKPAR